MIINEYKIAIEKTELYNKIMLERNVWLDK